MIRRASVLALIALALFGCAEEPENPVGLVPADPNQIPPIPIDLAAEVTSETVALRWTVANTTGVTGYRVWRAVRNGPFESVGTPPTPRFTDDQVITGTRYRYQVAAQRNGLEGSRSATISATPSIFSLVLEGGAEVTGGNEIEQGSRRINVDLFAPDSTSAYRISEDSSLVGAPFQGFALNTEFTLSAGDGLKRVFGRFQDIGGASSGLVQSTIRLDTRAVISSVTEDSNGATLGVDDVLHMEVEVDTTGGIVIVDLGNAFTELRLFDDGTSGDTTALDGSYERDFTVFAGVEAVNEVLMARFTDQVGNVASAVGSSTRVTIDTGAAASSRHSRQAPPPAGP